MLGELISILGKWFLIAVAIETLAVFAEQWGAARSPGEEAPKPRALALLALALTLVTPGLLLAHAYIATRLQDQTLLALAVGAPIAAVLAGALLGAIVGAAFRTAAPMMRKLSLPLDVLAFAVTVYAALPTIRVLLGAMENGGVVSMAP